MEMTDRREIAATPAEVYTALTDADMLCACVPGATEVEGSIADGFTATVVQKVGPVKATFKGTVTVLDPVPGERLRLEGEGKGGAAGFAKGSADVTLTATETGTRLDYDVEARVGGKLAQLGSRIIDGFAKKMADTFFDNLKTALEPPEEGDDPAADAADAPKKGWLARLTGGKAESA